MAIFKCKMCGGDLEITDGVSVCECEYCGTKQTLPRLGDDRKANLYDRANHFRRNNEFDKAASIYEQILNEDTTDAESYWSLVLCRYGIEYVEDPATKKRVPTVNRAQFTSIFDDENYKLAIANADTYQKAIYEEEANAINEIQKGILSISQKEDPYDVFICYKETDASGRRTPDSVLANDLYHQLAQEGFKVFFARITLEDKLGSAYEPYIFAALNSAKVMVVLGTKPEHFNAVWVKNEWSRYLALIKNDTKKTLIPAYRDMDPYDLPEEFSHLQAQDMSKLGFMQDLIRGIKKIIDAQVPKTTVVKETVISGGNANTAPLLKRAFMFLEDKEWDSADEYCEKVLDIDPECAEAYLGKLMVELNITTRQKLKNCSTPFDGKNSFQKAMRFADENLKNELQGYIEFILNRNITNAYNDAIRTMKSANTEEAYKIASEKFKELHDYKDSKELAQECLVKAEETRLALLYKAAVSAMNYSKTEQEYKTAARKFNEIKAFRDSEDKANLCLEKAEISRKDAIYDSAVSSMNEGTITAYKKAIESFKKIEDWKDSSTKIYDCERGIYEIEQKEEADRVEAARLAEEKRLEEERLAEEKRIASEKAAKKCKKIVAIVTPIVVACIAFFIVLTTVIIPNIKYNSAIELYNAGKYDDAITTFKALNGYKDSKAQITKCETAINDGKYNSAVDLYNAGKYDEAIAAFKALNGYKDSTQKLNETISQYKMVKLKAASVGDIVYFGTYEQDNNASNGKEYIEWLILAKEGNKVLAISKYALDCQRLNTSYTDVTWETCSLRKWLNGTFLSAVFSSEEQNNIINSIVTADRNPDWRNDISAGNNTTDKLFLLSITEVKKYFGSYSARQCQGTTYCYAKGAYKDDDDGTCWWWLRTAHSCSCANVESDGGIFDDGCRVDNNGAVRPAMWISLE